MRHRLRCRRRASSGSIPVFWHVDLAEQRGRTDFPGVRGVPFPTTRCSVLQELRSPDADLRTRAWAVVAEGYWAPVCAYLRLRWGLSHEDAEDATQDFFIRALTGGLLDRYDPCRARFRTYLRVCLDGHVANERQAAGRLKRGGGADTLSLSDVEPPSLEVTDVDALFEREWVRALCADALEELRRRLESRGRGAVYRVFDAYDVRGAGQAVVRSYADVAQEFRVPVTQVTNYLAAARREFRAVVLERLRQLTASEAEFRAEARALLGVDGGGSR